MTICDQKQVEFFTREGRMEIKQANAALLNSVHFYRLRLVEAWASVKLWKTKINPNFTVGANAIKKNIVCEDFQKGIYYISSWVTKEQYDDLIGQYYDVLKIGKSGCSDIVDSNYAKRNTYVQIVHWHMV